MADLFKEIIPSLLMTREYCFDEDYVPYVVNKALMQHIDCVFHVSEIDILRLDKQMQYDYYFGALKKYKRPYQKWLKKSDINNMEIIKKFYNCSDLKAKEILNILTNEQISKIEAYLDVGGNEKCKT